MIVVNDWLIIDSTNFLFSASISILGDITKSSLLTKDISQNNGVNNT